MKKFQISIFGSCVTRDIFNYDKTNSLNIVDYTARSSFGSAFAKQRFNQVPLENLDSPFQRNLVARDIHKKYQQLFGHIDFDMMIIDCIDERFALLQNNAGALATFSNELRRTGLPLGAFRRIASGSKEFFELWCCGWRCFIELVKSRGFLSRLYVNAVHWAYDDDEGHDYEPEESTPPPPHIAFAKLINSWTSCTMSCVPICLRNNFGISNLKSCLARQNTNGAAHLFIMWMPIILML
jgi:hypothetical protein